MSDPTTEAAPEPGTILDLRTERLAFGGATIARLVASLQLLPLAGGLLVSAAEAGALSEGGAEARSEVGVEA